MAFVSSRVGNTMVTTHSLTQYNMLTVNTTDCNDINKSSHRDMAEGER